jgi:predicted nuclease with TOPRIM domain
MSEENKTLEDRNALLENEMDEMQEKLDWFQTETRGLRQMLTKAESDLQSSLSACSVVESQLEGEKKKVAELLKSSETLHGLFTKVKQAVDKGHYKTSDRP